MDSGHFRPLFSQCALVEGPIVLSVLDPDANAGALWGGYGCLVGGRLDGRVDAACYLSLHLVRCAPVSSGSVDVRATAWPGTTDENGAASLTVGCQGGGQPRPYPTTK